MEESRFTINSTVRKPSQSKYAGKRENQMKYCDFCKKEVYHKRENCWNNPSNKAPREGNFKRYQNRQQVDDQIKTIKLLQSSPNKAAEIIQQTNYNDNYIPLNKNIYIE